MPMAIPAAELFNDLRRDTGDAPFAEAEWFVATREEDGFTATFPPGTLARGGLTHLTCDLLLDGFCMAVFQLTLHEPTGADGREPKFSFMFALLAQAQARLVVPLSATDQNCWAFDRQGALLKPMAWGDRVDLAKVERLTFQVIRRGEPVVRWAMTPMTAVAGEPPPLTDPVLPKGVLLDELGQSALRDWPGKSRTPAEVTARLNQQLAAARQQAWPKGFSRWGGWSGAKLTDATGFFAAHHDGDRWWLVDPDGHPFFSAGMDCTAPDPHAVYAGLDAALAWLPPADGEFAEAHTGRSAFNYLVASLIRAFGPADWKRHWRTITIAQLKKFGINTVGNWSDWEAASAAKFPYVRPLHYAGELAPNVFRDFPDVFHPDFPDDAADYASQLARTRDDPAMVGYFLMNEPTWGFARQSPAAGMLYTTDGGHAREALAAFVRDRHNTDAALAAAWGMAGVALADLAAGRWTRHLTAAAERDLDAFSTVMTARFFDTLSAACRAVDPNHLNLGARYYTVPPDWALAGMTSFDVFSINCYRERVPAKDLEHIGQLTGRPTLVGEWHFGALDVGLPASGIGHVPTQTDRGRAYRVYLEHAAALPWCVGVHHFTLYDESALGRFDGENYNVGFLDTCNRPYDPLCDAARRSHERMYGVAAGEQPPVDDAPQYLPKLFC